MLPRRWWRRASSGTRSWRLGDLLRPLEQSRASANPSETRRPSARPISWFLAPPWVSPAQIPSPCRIYPRHPHLDSAPRAREVDAHRQRRQPGTGRGEPDAAVGGVRRIVLIEGEAGDLDRDDVAAVSLAGIGNARRRFQLLAAVVGKDEVVATTAVENSDAAAAPPGPRHRGADGEDGGQRIDGMGEL